MLCAAARIGMRSVHMERATDFDLPHSWRLLFLPFRTEASTVFADVADPGDWAYASAPFS